MIQDFVAYPLFIKGIIVVIALSLIGWVFTYINILLTRWRGHAENKLVIKYGPAFNELFRQQIFINEDLDEDNRELALAEFEQKYLKSKRIRRILIEQILHFRTHFSGHTGHLLAKLYKDLNLERDALLGLKSSNTNRLIISIKELLDLEIMVDPRLIEKLTEHKNPQVREIARRYILKMDISDPFRVFNSFKEPISGWEQLELFKLIIELDNRKIPKFANWIHEDSMPSLVSLCLKLAVYFQQYDSIYTITTLLGTENLKIKSEAINALGKLNQSTSEEQMVSMYDNQSEEIKIEIIKALGRISSGNYLNLLKGAFDNEQSIQIRKHAARSIINHNSFGEKVLKALYLDAEEPDRIILNHAANTYIKY